LFQNPIPIPSKNPQKYISKPIFFLVLNYKPVMWMESSVKYFARFLETKFGKKHPDVAGSLADLGGLYEVQGKHSQARASYKRSLAIR